MSDERLFSLRNRWFVTSVGMTIGFVALVALGGMVVLPYAQPELKFAGLWDAICSAAGVPRARPSGLSPVEPTYKTTKVVVSSTMMGHPPVEAIGHGATIALQCAICHGPSGVSQSEFPNLAGQYASVIFKQLKDFAAGARVSEVMSSFADQLSDSDMRDVAAYFASLPRIPGYHPEVGSPMPRIVMNGAPLRGVAPCGSCHGGLDNKTGSPWLEGQNADYIKAQLRNFANGERRNDINEQMRNIARQLTPEEIDAAAFWYSSQQPTHLHTTMR